MSQESGRKNRIINALPYILAFCGTVGIQGIIAVPVADQIKYSNSLLSVLLFIGLCFILKKIVGTYVEADKRTHILSTVFAILFSVAMHFGARMEAVENVRMTVPSLWIGILLFAAFFAPVINAIWNLVSSFFGKVVKEKGVDGSPVKFLQVWGIIFLLWIPTFLALYPGAFVYDAQDEYIEVISRVFTTHHPLLHVVALGGIIHASEYIGWTANTGIAIYVVIQMLVVSAVLTYSIKLLHKWGLKKNYLTCVMVFYGIFPLFPLYAVCTAKDTYFTAFFMLIILLLIDYGNATFFNTKSLILFVASSVLMMLNRNNGMYAYLVAIPVIYLLMRKKNQHKNAEKDETDNSKKQDASNGISELLKLVILMLLSLALYFGCNYILKTVTSAEDSEHQEMLTVPIQQITRVYTYSKDVFSEDDISTLQEVLPEDYLITYRLRISDVLKSGFNNAAYDANPKKYQSLWLKIGLKKPLIYLNAWLGTSYGYWYPDALNNVYSGNQMFTFQYKDSSYFGFETEPPGVRESKFGVLESFYKKLSLELFQQKVPVVSMLFSPGFVFWIFMTVLFVLIRDRKKIMPLIPVMLLWLTVLLGPTTIVRYVLILWFIIPLYPALYSKKDAA